MDASHLICLYTDFLMESSISAFLAWFALPQVGLSTIFVVAAVSATLLPMGSEPVVLAYVSANPDMFWTAVVVATAGNTLGGAISWFMGAGAHAAWNKATHQEHPPHAKALLWLQKFGPKACLLSWLPVVGDPICAVAGWLRMPFWPCVFYMAIGKFLRYALMTWVLLQGLDGLGWLPTMG